VLIVNNLNIMNIASPPHFQITFPYSPIILWIASIKYFK
jgi:hypothetical protein